MLESYNTANLIENLKLNHIISDRGSICICDMYVCWYAFAWLYVWHIGILHAKAFSGFFMDHAHQFNSRMLASSIQREIVGTSKLETKN